MECQVIMMSQVAPRLAYTVKHVMRDPWMGDQPVMGDHLQQLFYLIQLNITPIRDHLLKYRLLVASRLVFHCRFHHIQVCYFHILHHCRAAKFRNNMEKSCL